jgi:hypothetical protein
VVRLSTFTGPLNRWAAATSLAKDLQPGEKVLASIIEKASDGYQWVATTKAVIVLPVASRENIARWEAMEAYNIPYSAIRAFEEEPCSGGLLKRRLVVAWPHDETFTLSGTFARRSPQGEEFTVIVRNSLGVT